MRWAMILKYRITIKDLEEERKRNVKSNRQFIDFYVDYMKSHTNKVWSRQQNRLINSVIGTKGRKKAGMSDGKGKRA
jgi:hypothetical protein